MTRPESPAPNLLDEVRQLIGPLGPLGSVEEWEAHTERFAASLTEDGLGTVLEAVQTGAIGQDDREGVQWLLNQALKKQAQRAPNFGLPVLSRFLSGPATRAIAISGLGSIRSANGLPLLRDLLINCALTETECVDLACSLGEIGTPEAVRLLRELRARPPLVSEAVQHEIDIALDTLGQG